MKAAVVLMAYGSPEREEEVGAYLSDIRGGRPVSAAAVEELAERYRRIGGLSPLNEITERQRAALERSAGLPVYLGMKHWRPRIAEAATRALAAGADVVVGLVLAPHYSSLSIAGYRERLEGALDSRAELRFVDSWHDHEPYVDAVADRVRGSDAHVVFTAHSLPARIREENDPYETQLHESAAAIAERAALDRWSFAFQSASDTGEPWLGPDILDELTRLHGEGVERVLAAPIGFVSDHLEILWDLDVEARERADALGLQFHRIDSLNDDPAFIDGLAGLVQETLSVPSKS